MKPGQSSKQGSQCWAPGVKKNAYDSWQRDAWSGLGLKEPGDRGEMLDGDWPAEGEGNERQRAGSSCELGRQGQEATMLVLGEHFKCCGESSNSTDDSAEGDGTG